MVPFPEIVAPVSSFVVALAFLLFLRRAVFGILVRKAKDGASRVDETIVRLFRTPSFLWCLIGATLVAIEVSTLPAHYRDPLQIAVHVALILSVTLAAANIAVALVRNSLIRAGSPALGSGIVYGMARFAVYTVGGLSILGKLGIAVAPLLTAFGVAGLAVALAFKDTLENAFSGIYLLLDRAIEVGDHVTLEGGQRGVIHDIGWRTSKVEMETGDMIIIPNVKLAQGIVIRRKR